MSTLLQLAKDFNAHIAALNARYKLSDGAASVYTGGKLILVSRVSNHCLIADARPAVTLYMWRCRGGAHLLIWDEAAAIDVLRYAFLCDQTLLRIILSQEPTMEYLEVMIPIVHAATGEYTTVFTATGGAFAQLLVYTHTQEYSMSDSEHAAIVGIAAQTVRLQP